MTCSQRACIELDVSPNHRAASHQPQPPPDRFRLQAPRRRESLNSSQAYFTLKRLNRRIVGNQQQHFKLKAAPQAQNEHAIIRRPYCFLQLRCGQVTSRRPNVLPRNPETVGRIQQSMSGTFENYAPPAGWAITVPSPLLSSQRARALRPLSVGLVQELKRLRPRREAEGSWLVGLQERKLVNSRSFLKTAESKSWVDPISEIQDFPVTLGG